METKVAPIITKYWVDDDFPFELLPVVKELNHEGTYQMQNLIVGKAITGLSVVA